jgi:hypothetical protein
MEPQRDDGLGFPRADIYGYEADILVRRTSAFDRFSDRE